MIDVKIYYTEEVHANLQEKIKSVLVHDLQVSFLAAAQEIHADLVFEIPKSLPYQHIACIGSKTRKHEV